MMPSRETEDGRDRRVCISMNVWGSTQAKVMQLRLRLQTDRVDEVHPPVVLRRVTLQCHFESICSSLSGTWTCYPCTPNLERLTGYRYAGELRVQ